MSKNGFERLVRIPVSSTALEGMLTVPEDAKGMVIFAHGSGSSRLSSRNNFVAQVLRDSGIGTLLFDLLTEEEDAVYENRFNIELLTERLLLATKWLMNQNDNPAMGYFGASTGAAAALSAAAELELSIKAVVSRGGRPDLAEPDLKRVKAATLLIVGGNDEAVIELNRRAYRQIQSRKKLTIIPGATHLFEEPGALEAVARLAAGWFRLYLAGE